MKRFTLADGMQVAAPSEVEARIIDREVTELRTYERNGIHVNDGDVIIDAGANAGVFAARMLQRHKVLRMWCFEPIPAVFEMLEANVAQWRGDSVVRTFNIALGSAPGEAVFEFDPQATFAATMEPEAVKQSYVPAVDPGEFARAALGDLRRSGLLPGGAESLLSGMTRWPLVGSLLTGAMDRARRAHERGAAARTQHIRCPVQTLSQVITDEGISHINLLKIDVEGAEEAVLQGILDAHWPHIRQLVVELHDVDGRRERVKTRLEALGFRVTVLREDWALHAIAGIWTLYATRAA